ncbi:pyroglutamyl-peptidase 1 isoform X2 [Pseudorasbora parva]|uniref:pyroglutamyl-peptidase 1 isoform X2 n=1 Tax=Pseudorasbora parva TaxID=51549 RepID=UPI00351F1438
MDTTSEIVVVTGFAPFRQYIVNLSWEAAKGLKVAGLGLGIDVQVMEIPVSYAKSQEVIDDIWQTMTPKVVIHLGIAPGAKGITLEQTGKNYCYKDRDVSGLCPVHHCCIEGGPERLDSIIDMRSLSKHLQKNMGLDVIFSRDAGRKDSMPIETRRIFRKQRYAHRHLGTVNVSSPWSSDSSLTVPV